MGQNADHFRQDEAVCRRGLLQIAAEYARDNFPPEGELSERWHSSSSLIEFAHTPQIPHVGIIRSLLAAEREARKCDGAVIYFVNDQLPPKLLPESRYTPIFLNGHQVAKPPRFGPSKSNSKLAMSHLLPPSPEKQTDFIRRLEELVGNVSLQPLVEAMEGASTAKSYASWLLAVSFGLLGYWPRVVPVSALRSAFPEMFDWLVKQRPDLFWCHCAACGRRLSRFTEKSKQLCCCSAASGIEAVPDVRARQCLANIAGLNLRVSGKAKPYQSEADSLTEALFQKSPPERLRVTGNVEVTDDRGNQIQRCNLVQARLLNADLLDLFESSRDDKASLVIGLN